MFGKRPAIRNMNIDTHYRPTTAPATQITNDDNIKFMAAACIFSLAQSADLCSDIAESGAADLALEDLANGGQPGQAGQEESEFLLAQLAIVAQVSLFFCTREWMEYFF